MSFLLAAYYSNSLSDIKQSHNHGRKEDIHSHFNEEVDTYHTEDKVCENVVIAHSLTPLCNGVKEEYHTAEKEDSRVYEGAYYSGKDNGKSTVFLFESLADESCGKTCHHTLEKYCDYCTGYADCKEGGGIGHEYCNTEDEAEPGADFRSAHSGTDYDRYENERNGEGTEADELTEHLKNDYHSGEDCSEGQGAYLIYILSAFMHKITSLYFLLNYITVEKNFQEFFLHFVAIHKNRSAS